MVLPRGAGTLKSNGRLYLETLENGHVSVFYSAEMEICIIYFGNDTIGVLYDL